MFLRRDTRQRALGVALVFLWVVFLSCDSGEGGGSNSDGTVDRPSRVVSHWSPTGTHPILELGPDRVEVPFPSFYFTRPDGDSVTGARLTFDKLLPDDVQTVLKAVDETDVAEAAGELDGFSVLGPVLLPFSDALDLVPWTDYSMGDRQDPGSGFLQLHDLSVSPCQPLGLWYSFIEGDNVLTLTPTRPLRPGHRYLVCIVGPLLDAAGAEVVRPVLFDAVMHHASGLPDDPLIDDLRDVREVLESGAIDVDPDDVLLAFTIPVESGVSQIQDMREVIDSLDSLVPSAVEFQDPQTITGTFSSPEFRSGDTILFDLQGRVPDIQNMSDLSFIVRLPDSYSEPLRPVIYLHGIGGSRYAAPTIVGMAIFAIDAVRHGDRADPDSEAPFPFIDLYALRTFRDNLRQTAADHMAFARIVRRMTASPAVYGLPDNLFALDSLAVLGHSLGCLNGLVFASVDPQVDHLACVAGGGMFSWFHSESAYGFFAPAAIRGLPPREKMVVIHLTQAILDPGDPVAVAPGLVLETPDGRSPRNALIVEVIGDRAVPNRSTEAFAWSAGIGVNEGAPSNVFGLPEWPLPVVGNIDATTGTATALLVEFEIDVTPAERHEALFSHPQQLEQVRIFLETAADTGIAKIVDPVSLR